MVWSFPKKEEGEKWRALRQRQTGLANAESLILSFNAAWFRGFTRHREAAGRGDPALIKPRAGLPRFARNDDAGANAQ
ncbi:MAG: hypothetical protein ABIR13_03025 [Polaromonas sp.]